MSRSAIATIALCVGALPVFVSATPQQDTNSVQNPQEVTLGEWVGRCEKFGGSTPSADCSLIHSNIKPQLELFQKVKQWAEPKRTWSEPPKLLPAAGPFKVLYVNNKASSIKHIRDSIGGYSEGFGLFLFNQSDMQEASPGKAAAIDSGWSDMHRYVAHEMFHAYQASSPFSRTYYQTRPMGDLTFAWIWEGSAEAVGLVYQIYALGNYHDVRSPNYYRPLHLTADEGYDRGEFWLSLAKVVTRGGDLAQFLFKLHESPERLTIGEPMAGIAWLDRQLPGAGLRDGYGKVIAQLPIKDRYKPNPESKTDYKPPMFDANAADVATEVRSDPIEIPELAASAFYARLPAAIMKTENAELPGRKLVLFELQIDARSTPERVGMVVEREWIDLAMFTRLLVPEGKEVKFLGRATNVDMHKPEETTAAQAQFNLISRAVNLSGPTCASVGKSSAITIDYAENGLGNAPKLVFQAKRGKFTGENYTAPATPGPDTLSVQAYRGEKGEKQVWVAFEQLNVRARCSVVLIGPDGSRHTYDEQANATRVEDGEGGSPIYLDQKGIVALDPDTGKWFRVPHLQSPPAGAPVLAVQVTAHGTNLSALSNGPAALVDLFKRTRKESALATPRATESPAACPSGGGTCVRFTHPAQADAAIYFDQAGDPVGFEAEGEMTRIEYTGDTVVVPSA